MKQMKQLSFHSQQMNPRPSQNYANKNRFGNRWHSFKKGIYNRPKWCITKYCIHRTTTLYHKIHECNIIDVLIHLKCKLCILLMPHLFQCFKHHLLQKNLGQTHSYEPFSTFLSFQPISYFQSRINALHFAIFITILEPWS